MQKKSLTVSARAKINLTLDVGPLRTDGYHDVSMIMTTLGLKDTLIFTRSDAPGVSMSSNVPGLDASDTNIAWRVLVWMRQTYALNDGIDVFIDKQIPMAAGLAGGSADAAAVIRGINQLYGLDLSMETMMEIGARFGSDVPFCVLEKTAFASGRGEKLRVLSGPMPHFHVILVNPDFGISTAWSYSVYDEKRILQRPDQTAMEQAICLGEGGNIGALLINVLEPHTFFKYPVLERIKEDLLKSGAVGALMSGSGPTVYGLYTDGAAARKAAMALGETYPDKYLVTLTTTEE